MRVLTVAATPFFSNRGCHIRIYNEAKYLQKLGAFVEICTYHNGENIEGLKIHRIGDVSWYKKTSPGFAWGKLWLDLKLLFLCVKILRKSNFDIIHAHLFESLVIAKFARFLAFKKTPIVLDLQGDLADEFSSYNKKNILAVRIFTWLSKIVFKWADSVVVSSQNSYEKIKEKYKLKKSLLVVQDGIDLDMFNFEANQQNLSSQKELNEIKNWKSDSNVIFYAGGMNDSKGVGDVLDFFIQDCKNLNWKLLLFGNGDDLEKYKEVVEKLSLQNNIWFTNESGYFQLPSYAKLADVAVDPKQNSSESSGKIVTYMTAGLSIICFDNNFNRKILGKKGSYLNDWDDLSLKLNEIERSDFSEKISYNLERFSEEDQVELLIELFKKLLK